MNLRDLIPYRKHNPDMVPFMMSFQQEINHLFDSMFSNIDVFPTFPLVNRFPCLNVIEQDTKMVVTAELPGMDEKDITIETNKNQLIIQGKKKSESEEKDETYRIRELSYGKFSRVVSLPFDIDVNKTKASFAKGVLTIFIEKPKEQFLLKKMIPISHEAS